MDVSISVSFLNIHSLVMVHLTAKLADLLAFHYNQIVIIRKVKILSARVNPKKSTAKK